MTITATLTSAQVASISTTPTVIDGHTYRRTHDAIYLRRTDGVWTYQAAPSAFLLAARPRPRESAYGHCMCGDDACDGIDCGSE